MIQRACLELSESMCFGTWVRMIFTSKICINFQLYLAYLKLIWPKPKIVQKNAFHGCFMKLRSSIFKKKYIWSPFVLFMVVYGVSIGPLWPTIASHVILYFVSRACCLIFLACFWHFVKDLCTNDTFDW